MVWEKPFELFKDEYELTIRCLKTGVFRVEHDEAINRITVYRESTNEPILFHFFPGADTIKYNKQNEQHTYYQVGDINPAEQKEPEELPRRIVLEDPVMAQKFFTEIMNIQKE